MLKFFEDHKDIVTAVVGMAAVTFAPKLGVPSDQLTHDAYVVGGIVIGFLAQHGYRKQAAAEAPKP